MWIAIVSKLVIFQLSCDARQYIKQINIPEFPPHQSVKRIVWAGVLIQTSTALDHSRDPASSYKVRFCKSHRYKMRMEGCKSNLRQPLLLMNVLLSGGDEARCIHRDSSVKCTSVHLPLPIPLVIVNEVVVLNLDA